MLTRYFQFLTKYYMGPHYRSWSNWILKKIAKTFNRAWTHNHWITNPESCHWAKQSSWKNKVSRSVFNVHLLSCMHKMYGGSKDYWKYDQNNYLFRLIFFFACIGLVLDFLLCFCKKIGKIFHEEVVLKKYHDLYKLFKQWVWKKKMQG